MEKSNRKFGEGELRPAGVTFEDFEKYGAKGAPIPYVYLGAKGSVEYQSSNVDIRKHKAYPNENMKLPPLKVEEEKVSRKSRQQEKRVIDMTPPVVASIVKLHATPARTRRIVKK